MSRYQNSVPVILDGNGKPIVGAKKFFFNQGTTTKKTIYSDSDLTIVAANPVISDGNGRIPDTFLDGLYKEEQQDNSGTATGYDGVTLWTRDPVGELATGPFELWDSSVTYEIPDIVKGSDDEYYRSLVDGNTGSDPILSLGNWEKLNLGRFWESGVTYAAGDTVYGSDGYLYTSKTSSNAGNDPTTNIINWSSNAPFKGCLVYSSVQLTYTTVTKELLWDSEFYDTNNIHSTSAETGRLTVPSGVTKIRLSYSNRSVSSGPSTFSIMRIYKNGVTSFFREIIATPTGGGGPDFTSTTPVINVTAGDYFQLYMTADANTVTLVADEEGTSFGMEIIE